MEDDCLIVEWPHSRYLGERWFVYPPSTAPSGKNYPGLKAFTTRENAIAHADELGNLYGDH